MALRNIVKQGDPVLGKVCRPVTEFNGRLHLLLNDMLQTVQDANGAGLAAPQVGILRACALVMQEDGSFLEIINPKIIRAEGSQDGVEGCLSVPGVWGMVERPYSVTVEAQDRYGNTFTVDAEGFTARAFCHEIDHLSGHLYVEKVSRYVTEEEIEQA